MVAAMANAKCVLRSRGHGSTVHGLPRVKLRPPSNVPWPEGKDFAFTVFDDTDRATVENNRAIYGLLAECGLRTTKTVWALTGVEEPEIPGDTCDDPEYLKLCLDLQALGFEIAWHLATHSSSKRERTERGLNRFREMFGHHPESMANHSSNREGIYWGPARLTGWRRLAYLAVQRGQKFRGHIEDDPCFWGDLCKERVRYVRNFTFHDLNTLACCPHMPYADPARPWVNQWFAGSDGADVDQWNRFVTDEAVDKLAAERGACILYTHFGKGFHEDGRLDERFEASVRRLGRMNGWYVPVRTLLDFLATQQPKPKVITSEERAALENHWLVDQIEHSLRKH